MDDFVNVAVRLRPLKSDSSCSCVQFISKEPPVVFVSERKQTFAFDNIFAEDDDQETVYQAMVKPLVDRVKEGYNCTVFAYGQTGTGKTYTIGSNPKICNVDEAGFISRTLDDFFYNTENVEVAIWISFYEIYNEKVFDLLVKDRVPLQVKEFKVQGLIQQQVSSVYQAHQILEIGSKNRHTSGTNQNSNSSRSHAIFTVYCNVKYEDNETFAKLNLVDLAGSESVRKTGNQGAQFHEGVNINKGLLCIGQVMNALSTNRNHIPYRQSMVTTILQDSLNKKNYVTLVACVSPDPDDTNETVQTLDFAQRAKRLKNKPELNKIITNYKKENPGMFERALIHNTPYKLTNSAYRTPLVNRNTVSCFSAFRTPIVNSSSMSSSVSSFSTNFSSVSTSTENISKNLSPPVKGNTSSPLEKENIEKSMLLNLENTVERIVQKELKKLSSPLRRLERLIQIGSERVEPETPVAKRILNFEEDSPQSADKQDVFKVPDLPLRNKRRKPSADEGARNEPKRRRSVRLSLKNDSKNNFEEDFADDSPYSSNKPAERRSVRLSLKKSKTKQQDENLDDTFEDFDISMTSSLTRRRSTRVLKEIDNIQGIENVSKANKKVPLPIPKHIKTGSCAKDSPRTSHNKYVLNILNNGSSKDLESLSTIGKKSASLIHVHRKLNGRFDKIQDVETLPIFRGRGFERFCAANFLKIC